MSKELNSLELKGKPIVALILAAGRGERMNSARPKVLHEAAGLSLLGHVLETVRACGIRQVGIVVSQDAARIRSEIGSLTRNAKLITQAKQLGTAHAVLQAKEWLKTCNGTVLILPGDAPCLGIETLKAFARFHAKERARASILTADLANPYGYGRMIRRAGAVAGIREEPDLKGAEREISEVNSGIYLFQAAELLNALAEIKKNKKKKEYYLTDVIEKLVSRGSRVAAYKIGDAREILGVNTKRDLAMAHQAISQFELDRHLKSGAAILNPAQTFIARGVRIGRDTVIHPFTWIERDVVIGSGCEIGPFAKIRSGSRIANGAVIGSFVEVVRSRIGSKTFVKHLAYLGDAEVGKGVNIGAGTITANFDGRRKNKTVIEDRAFIGCDTILVAPAKVGRGAKTGAGAVVTAETSVPSGKTFVGVPARPVPDKKRTRTKKVST